MEKLKKIPKVDLLVSKLSKAFKWELTYDAFVDADGKIVRWDDSDSIPISLKGFTQISMWGDGTIELQEDDGESTNIYEYDIDTINSVILELDKHITNNNTKMKEIEFFDAEDVRKKREAEFEEGFDFDKFNEALAKHFEDREVDEMTIKVTDSETPVSYDGELSVQLWQVPHFIPYLIDCHFEVEDYSKEIDPQGYTSYIKILL